MENFFYDSQFERMKKDISESLEKSLVIETKRRKITVNKVWVDDRLDTGDFDAQSRAVKNDRTWGVPVYASMDLIDKTTGKKLSGTKKLRVATLPKNTLMGSFIVKGKHYQVNSQLRRKPGVYVLRRGNKEIESQFSVPGKQFSIRMEPEKQRFMIHIGQSDQPLYPLLSRMGVSDGVLAKAWGEDVLRINKAVKAKRAENAVRSIAKSMMGQEYESADVAASDLRDHLEKVEISAAVTKRTLGKAYNNVSVGLLVHASSELLGVHRGDRLPDEPEGLEFKKVLSVADFIKERVDTKSQKLRGRIVGRLSTLNPPTDIRKVISTNEATPVIESFFTQADLSTTPDQTNPVHMLNGLSNVTIMGEGGIRSEHGIKESERALHPSHLGFIDPVHTPDSGKIGTTMHLASGAQKSDDNELVTLALDMSNGKGKYLTPGEIRENIVAMPDQFDRKTKKFIGKKVRAMVDGQIQVIDAKKVDYVLGTSKQAFSVSANLIPFLPSTQGNRSQMSTKMMEQAIPLTDREAPLVQSKIGNATWENMIGDGFSLKAADDGVVVSSGPTRIAIKHSSGTKAYALANNYPLNGKSFIHQNSSVSVGDKVKKGQVIADSNFTQGGVLSLGTNLRAAYIPFKGYNFEDGIVITESAAKKLTSEHMYQYSEKLGKEAEFSLGAYTGWKSGDLDIDQQAKLGDDGIVRKGQVLQKGDPIWVGVRENLLDPDAIIMSKYTKMDPKRPFKKTWDNDSPGKVIDVIRKGGKVKVYIKAQEPAQIGDKVTNRHAAKGIITRIIPDGESPHTADGEPIDILLNPHGVVSRINPSQLLETIASKIAEKTGKPYVVDNFSGENYSEQINADLKRLGLSDTEPLFDAGGKKLGDVLVGRQYTMKLSKQATSQFSARSSGKYDADRAPKRGGEDGGKALDLLTMYSMLAHGSRVNLREMATYKATQNQEFWNWLQAGSKWGKLQPLPEPTFAYKKFEAYLKGAGVDVKRKGSQMVLAPMTDREVTRLSNGEVKEPLFLRAKDLQKTKGGLLDPIIHGADEDQWSHYNLAEPVPNPMFEEPVKKLLGLTDQKFKSITFGKMYFDPKEGDFNTERRGLTGGHAIKSLLKNIDLDSFEKEWKEKISSTRSAPKRDEANKILRYIRALKVNKLKPDEAYILNKLPIIPPRFRPVFPLPDGTLSYAGINNLYRDVGLVNNELKWQNSKKYIPDTARAELREGLYEGVKAITGIKGSNQIAFYQPQRRPKGFIKEIKGETAKTGFFQDKVLRRTQDIVGRGTIIPEPKLGIDEVGLPKDMAWNIFKPFVVRDLVGSGMHPNDALDAVDERSALALASLEAVMQERPVLLNRAPSLHKFSIMAFKPKLTDGRAVKIPPLIVKGFNADFDGNCISGESKIVLKFTDKGSSLRTLNNVEGSYGMKFAGKTKVSLRDSDGLVVETEIQQVPYLPDTGRPDKHGAMVYDVPSGVCIWSYDHAGNRPVIAPVTGLTIEENCPSSRVMTRLGFEVVASDNESLCAYDHDEETVVDICPKDSLGRLSPVLRKMPLTGDQGDFEFGWMMGAFVSDGFLMGETIGYSKVSQKKRDRFAAALNVYEGSRVKRTTYRDYHDASKEITGESVKDHFYKGRRSYDLFSDFYVSPRVPGRACLSKQLPPLSPLSRDARLGVLLGLLEGDGSVSVSSRGRVLASFATSSVPLVDSVRELCLLLGIRLGVTKYGPKEGRLQRHDAFMLTLSICDVAVYAEELLQRCCDDGISAALEMLARDGVKKDDRDIVPVPSRLMKLLTSKKTSPVADDGSLFRSLSTIKSARKSGVYVSRPLARTLLGKLREASVDVHKWGLLVEATDVHWDSVKTVTPVGGIKVFDLIIPSTKVFAVNGGLVVWDTMTVHVPIFQDAIEEARKMFPSKNLYNPGTGDIVVMPMNESALGLYQMSKTPEGRKKIDAALPGSMKGKYKTLNKSGLGTLIKDLAKDQPSGYGSAVDKLKTLGDDYTYSTGFTVSLKDLIPSLPKKNAVTKALARELAVLDTTKPAEREKAISLISAADVKLEKGLREVLGAQENSLFQMVDSGARGNMGQLKQIISAPMLVDDHLGNPVPFPVVNSYAAGLPFSDYWSTLYGARRVAMDKQLQTSKPGAFAKDIMAASISTVISSNDCKTTNGVSIDVGSRDVEDRFLAKDIKIGSSVIARAGTAVSSTLLTTLRDHKVKKLLVRSPLTCSMPKGICGKCYGLGEMGEELSMGENVGAISAQSLSEPLTQMTLRTFHSGGLSGSRTAITGYDKIDKLLKLHTVRAGKATLAKKSGVIEKKERAPGGVGANIWIGGDKHFVPPGARLQFKIGAKVKKGDKLTDGLIQPQELSELKGILPAQEYMVDEIQKSYGEQNVRLKRRAIETIIRSSGNVTRVVDPGDSDFIAHDIVPYTVAEDFNNKVIGTLGLKSAVGKVLREDVGSLKSGTTIDDGIAKALQSLGKTRVRVSPKPIVHKPFLAGVMKVPLLSDDWMAQMGYQRLEQAIVRGAERGGKTDLHSYHPVPAFAYGAEFGDSILGATDGKY